MSYRPCCLNYAGSEYDHMIASVTGHHPNCQKLKMQFSSPLQKAYVAKLLVNLKEADLPNIANSVIDCFLEDNIVIIPL